MKTATCPGSTTDRAAQIREQLKKKYGWTGRDVSVKADYYSMGSAIRIRIKNPNVASAAVEAIAQGHESIDRDQWGEILSGGNRFVDIHYDYETVKVIGVKWQHIVNDAIADRQGHNDTSLIELAGTPYLLGTGMHGDGFALWHKDKGHICEYHSAESCAQGLGVAMLNRKYANIDAKLNA